jgi:hypothetical protein
MPAPQVAGNLKFGLTFFSSLFDLVSGGQLTLSVATVAAQSAEFAAV